MPSKNLATLSFNTFLFLVPHAVLAATIAAAFFWHGFLVAHAFLGENKAGSGDSEPARTGRDDRSGGEPTRTSRHDYSNSAPAHIDRRGRGDSGRARTKRHDRSGGQPTSTTRHHRGEN
jgi:hypothetical protein